MEEHEHEFIQFLAKYRKTYGTKEEYNYRLSVFAEKYYFIKEENASQDSYRLAINKFSDMNNYEYSQMLGFRPSSDDVEEEVEDFEIGSSSVNWVNKGAVTEVKDQGSCGSCWSFSTTGQLEGLYEINKGKLLSFSEQQFVDCDTTSAGCNGGNMLTALKWAA